MKIGKLNDFFETISVDCHFAGTDLVPQTVEAGNPAKGQLLQIKWDEFRDEELALDIRLPQPCFLDTVELQFGPKTALAYAMLKQEDAIVYTYRAETGNARKRPSVRLEFGRMCQDFTILLSCDFTSLQLEEIGLFGGVEDGVDLFPTPNQLVLTGKTLPHSLFTGCSGDCPQAAAVLQEKYLEKTGIALKSEGNIRFVTDGTIAPDGYQLDVSDEGAVIRASNLRGFVYGSEVFIKLVTPEGVAAVSVSDAPFKPFRGVHLFIPSMDKMDFAKRLIKYLISPMGYNTVILQVSGGMIYERHPEISAAFAHAVEMRAQGWPVFPHNGIAEGKPITKDALREYIRYIRSFGITVIPEVQSLAHVQYLTHAFPEIAEIPEEKLQDNVDTLNEDKLPSTFYHHDYCPSNPRTYEILFDVIDEIVEVFAPVEYIHMGHDEVRSIGVCPRCKGKTPAELFADDINKIHDYLSGKGIKMMIWADMLQPMPKYPTHPAIDRIPKDIVLLDFIWYFHLDKDIEDNLLAKDFDVLIGNLYSSHFPRYESRIRKPGLHGGQISAWVATNEYELQKEGKLYDLQMTAQPLWAESYTGNYRLCYDRILSANMPRLRDALRGTVAPSRQSGTHVETVGINARYEGQVTEFSVGGRCESLIFRHTAMRNITRRPWSELSVVAKYIITYENGETEEVPVTYGGNLGYRGRRQNAPLLNPFYRHTGYTATYYSDSETLYHADGSMTTTYIYEYVPEKQLPIASVRLEQDPAFQAKVFWQGLQAVTR